MRIYNSDGSEPEMCGNGIRCLARFVADVDEKKNGKSSTPSSGSPANANANSTAAVATGAGIIRPEVLSDGLIRVDMGPPTLSPALVPTTLASTGKSSPFEQSALDAVVAGEVRSGGDTWLVTCVSMGNPHAVTFGKSDGSAIEDVDAVDLAGPGAEMVRLFYEKVFSCPLSFFLFRVRLEAADENSTHALSLSLSLSLFPFPPSLFSPSPPPLSLDCIFLPPKQEKSPVFPAKTNVEFVQVLSPSHCKMRVWERGAGPTLACGTGACATVVAGVLEGKLDRKCRVDLPGGPLFIEWVAEDGVEGGGVGGTVYMTGPAEWVFEGEVKVE